MSILVAYASKHGATKGIAERIADRLRSAGLEAEARPVKDVRGVAGYDAFVIGSALYLFHWMKEAQAFVRHSRGALAGRPVWLFSCGPIGTETVDKDGRNVVDVAGPRELPDLIDAVHPREHHVFFGAYDPNRRPIGLGERFIGLMPAARAAFPAGDFRDWAEIEAWADAIARDLSPVSAGAR